MTPTQALRDTSPSSDISPVSATASLAARASALRYEHLTPEARTIVGHCLLDFFGVTLAGCHEPLANILAEQIAEDGGAPQATVIGRNTKVSIEQAALINGAMSHALDYDDVNLTMGGHPTVPVAPAVLALCEWRGLDGKRLVESFAAGFETECRLGRMMAPSHYRRGWHVTATVGAIGAAAAISNLLRLDAATTAHALGIAATQAAGLKSVFGTMCKPLHAGRAAAIGLQAARLASRGFTSNTDILDVPQGFAATQCDVIRPELAIQDPPGGFYLPRTLFKYHAACYLTHSSIEASNRLREQHRIAANDVARVTMKVDEGHLGVCNIEKPSSGLELKFSLRATNALALLGENTANDGLFSDTTAGRGDVVDLCRKFDIQTWKQKSSTLSEVTVEMKNGQHFTETFDVGIPITDLEAQGASLRRKFSALAEPLIGADRALALIEMTASLETVKNTLELMVPAVKVH